MRGVRPARGRVDHQLGVAMIGGNQQRAPFCSHCRLDTSEAGIHRFDGFDSGLDFSGVADHIGISEIHDDHVKRAVLHRFHDCVGYAGCRHLRLEIVGSDSR